MAIRERPYQIRQTPEAEGVTCSFLTATTSMPIENKNKVHRIQGTKSKPRVFFIYSIRNFVFSKTFGKLHYPLY